MNTSSRPPEPDLVELPPGLTAASHEFATSLPRLLMASSATAAVSAVQPEPSAAPPAESARPISPPATNSPLRPLTPPKVPRTVSPLTFRNLAPANLGDVEVQIVEPEAQRPASSASDAASTPTVVVEADSELLKPKRRGLKTSQWSTLIECCMVHSTVSPLTYHFVRGPEAKRDGDEWAQEVWPRLPEILAAFLDVEPPSSQTFFQLFGQLKLGKRQDTTISKRARQACALTHPNPRTPTLRWLRVFCAFTVVSTRASAARVAELRERRRARIEASPFSVRRAQGAVQEGRLRRPLRRRGQRRHHRGRL